MIRMICAKKTDSYRIYVYVWHLIYHMIYFNQNYIHDGVLGQWLCEDYAGKKKKKTNVLLLYRLQKCMGQTDFHQTFILVVQQVWQMYVSVF